MTLRLPFWPLCAAVFAVAAVAAPPARAQTSYRIDPATSQIVYSMSHPTHRWSGTSRSVSGVLAATGTALTGGRVQAPVRSFDSGVGARDRNMARETEADRYPAVTFEARSVTMLPAAQQTAARNATVRGVLTFHGVARPVTVPVRADVSGGRARLTGSFEVTLTEFGLARPSLLGIRSRDWIALRLDLTARS